MRLPLSFIRASQSSPSSLLPGRGWAHELKHDGYRLQIHVRDGRVRLYTINGYDWSDRYPLIVEEGLRINVTAIMDAEVICTDGKGIPTFEKLHSRCNDHLAFACAFDLLMVGGEDVRHLPFAKRKAALRKLLKADRGGIQYVEHADGHGDKLFAAACQLGLEGIISKKIDAPYKSGPSKAWLKIKTRKHLPPLALLMERSDRRQTIAEPPVVELSDSPASDGQKGESRNPSPARQTRDDKFRGCDRHHKIVLQIRAN